MLTLKTSICYSCIQSYIDCFGNNLIASYSPKITQPLDEQYQQAVMTHIVLFALQINSKSVSVSGICPSPGNVKNSHRNKLACFNFLMQDSDLLTVHEWKNDKGRKRSLQEVGKKVCLQLTFKRDQKLELPQELLSKYQPFRSGHQTESIPRHRVHFLFLIVN